LPRMEPMPIERPEGDRIDLMSYFAILYRKRWIILTVTIAAAAVSVVIAVRQKPLWTSTSKLLPSESRNEAPALAGLAALAGLSMPQAASPETFYRDILLSNDFLDTLVWSKWTTRLFPDRIMTLAEVYEFKVDTTKALWKEAHRQKVLDFIRKKRIVDFERDPSGLMTLSSTTIDPLLSYELNVFLINRLDDYNRLKKKTHTTEKKTLIEDRLKDVEESLSSSEERLRQFREKNLSVSTPGLLLNQQRLLREIEVNGAVYQELRKQYEITKIEIVDNTQFLNILEKPMIPALHGKSTRRKFVMILTILGFLVASIAVLANEKIQAFRAEFGSRNS
jgi:uncharacterized protein involved in exopolysaccharide biosynthesis